MDIFKNAKETEKLIEKAEALLKQGIPKDRISAALSIPEEIRGIAAARIRNEKAQKTSHKNLYMTLDDLRFATNEKAAKYRAKRLKCGKIIEIGSGIGLQSIEFAKTCKKVIAIEIDKRKHNYAMHNAEALGIKNIEFINADALKLNPPKADIVFCETERKAEEAERKAESIKPNIKKLLEIYRKITKDICIEVPPQMQDIKFDCEREYISVNHELNRLNLYFGKLKKCRLSAAIAETGERLEDKGKKLKESRPLSYLYEADGAVKKAGLEAEIPLSGIFNCGECLTSEKKLSSPFFKAAFEIKAKCKGIRNIFSELKKADCRKVVLRIKISPEKYWEERKKYEDELQGSETCHLFSSKDEMLVCKKLMLHHAP